MAGSSPAEVRQHFDALGASWDRVYEADDLMGQAAVTRLRGCLALLGDPTGKRILDLGCGSGALLAEVGALVATYDGVDVAPAMVDATRERAIALGLGSRVTVQEQDAATLRYASGSFDLVVCLGLLGFVEDPTAVLGEAFRVLRPDGRLVVSAGRRHQLDALTVALTRPARSLVRRFRSSSPPRLATYSDSALVQLIRAAGGSVVETRYIDMRPLPYPLTRIWPRLARRCATPIEGNPRFKLCATGCLIACAKERPTD